VAGGRCLRFVLLTLLREFVPAVFLVRRARADHHIFFLAGLLHCRRPYHDRLRMVRQNYFSLTLAARAQTDHVPLFASRRASLPRLSPLLFTFPQATSSILRTPPPNYSRPPRPELHPRVLLALSLLVLLRLLPPFSHHRMHRHRRRSTWRGAREHSRIGGQQH